LRADATKLSDATAAIKLFFRMRAIRGADEDRQFAGGAFYMTMLQRRAPRV
jgi:hypothetical protein